MGRRPGDPLLCGRCRLRLRPLREQQGIATALAYEGAAAELVRRFKFQGRRDALDVLLPPLDERARSALQGHAVAGIVPVPRHARRIRELGADPVHRLAQGLARELGLPLLAGALFRVRPTPPQTGLSPAARRENVRESFGARPIPVRRLLLIDDVVTTGATLREAVRTLREQGGVEEVLPLALAATPQQPPRTPGSPMESDARTRELS